MPQLPVRLTWALLALVATAPARALEWRVELGPEEALYPVLDLSQSGRRNAGGEVFGDGGGLLQVTVRATQDAQRVHLRLDAPYLAQPAELDALLPRAGQRYALRPRLQWDTTRLATLSAPTDTTLEASLDAPGEAMQTRRVHARLHPLDEALYYARDGSDHVDLSWIFAAYADPRAAAVEALLERARRAHPGLRLDGEAAAAPEARAQLFALWEAAYTHGVRYAEEDPGVARGPRLWSQRVRRHDEVWAQRRANCLDGSLLLAAAAERLGLHAVLLLVPRHALLAVYARADAGAALFLETTLLGTPRQPADRAPAFLDRLEGDADAAALGSFEAALGAGAARYRRESAHFGRHDPNYQWIDLATARAYGILPLSTATPAATGSRASP